MLNQTALQTFHSNVNSDSDTNKEETNYVIVATNYGFNAFEVETKGRYFSPRWISRGGIKQTAIQAADELRKIKPDLAYIEIINHVSSALQLSAMPNYPPHWRETDKKG